MNDNKPYNPQYVGKVKKMEAASGKIYYKGRIGNVPVVGFYGNKNPDEINFKIDVGMVNWIDQKDDKDQAPPGNRKDDKENPFG